MTIETVNKFRVIAVAESQAHKCSSHINASLWQHKSRRISRTVLTVISRPLVSIGSRRDMMPAMMAITLYIVIATWTDTRSSTCTGQTHTYTY